MKPKEPATLPDLLAYIAKQKAETRAAPEPPEVEYFQQTWQKLSTGLRLKQSAQQVPENAGPLNSTQLIHRALLQMQETSPEYLQHFLSYLDTLSWMEQLHAANSSPLEKAQSKPGPSTVAKRPTKSPNKRPTSR